MMQDNTAPVEIQESMRNGQRFQVQRNDEWTYNQRWLMQKVSFTLPIYISSYKSAKNKTELQENGITHILMVKDEKETYIQPSFPDLFIYQQVLLQNSPFESLTRLLHPVGLWIRNVVHGDNVSPLGNENRLLIHCVGGISRAPAIVCGLLIGYLMEFEGYTYDHAFMSIQQQRLCINLIDTFATQLKGYEISLEANRQIFKSTLTNGQHDGERIVAKRYVDEMDEIEVQEDVGVRHDHLQQAALQTLEQGNVRMPIIQSRLRKPPT